MMLMSSDDEPGHRIALDELHRAVHAAVQLAFDGERRALAARLFGREKVRAQIGVDAHLFAGQRIERGSARRLRPRVPEPFAITMNCTVVMITNTTMPTTRLPPTTSSPKLSMMLPASACSRDRLGRRNVQRQAVQRGEKQ